LLLSARGENTSAKEELQKSLELAPSLAEAHVALAQLAKSAHDSPAVIRELQAALGWEPQDRQIHLELVDALKSSGRIEESDREMQIVQKLSAAHSQ
jgi:Tfp pilus assembly protein PilF